VVPGKPAIVLDVAHNPHAALALADALRSHAWVPDQAPPPGPRPRTHAIFGMLRDKDAAGVVAALRDVIDDWHFVPTSGERGRAAAALAQAVSGALQAIPLPAGSTPPPASAAGAHGAAAADATDAYSADVNSADANRADVNRADANRADADHADVEGADTKRADVTCADPNGARTHAGTVYESVGAALLHLRSTVAPDDRIVVFGSFVIVAEALRCLERGSQ
jgi:folylpolyglutamate synthase/dihydropteroate synthase